MGIKKDTQVKVIHRLKIAKGHLDKVIKMVEEGDYCIDVINQSRAVQMALKESDSVILEEHLQTCVVDHIRKGETKKTVDEIMKIFKNSGK